MEYLEDVDDGSAKFKQRLVEADMGRVKQHQFKTSHERPMDELL